MKRYIKIMLFTASSLFLLLLITISIFLWLVFTPERLTPLVRKQTEKHIPYHSEIGSVELTFFSTFPRFGIKMRNFAIISPLIGAACDTLMKLEELTGVIDAGAYWKNGDLTINRFILSNGYMNVFSDSLGQSNYSLLLPDIPAEDEQPRPGISFLTLENIELKNLSISFIDMAAGTNASLKALSAGMTGAISEGKSMADIIVRNAQGLIEHGEDKLIISVSGFRARVDGSTGSDSYRGQLDLRNAIVSLHQEGEKIMDQARLKFNIPFEFMPARQSVKFKKAFASVNELGFSVNGQLGLDTLQNIVADLSYNFTSWQVKEALKLIPPAFLTEFAEFDLKGHISCEGTIRGVLNDSLMPVIEFNMTLEKGSFGKDGFPYQLNEVNYDIHVFADFANDEASFLSINGFEAKSAGSTFKTRGRVNRLFSDMQFDLISEVSLEMGEISSLIPGIPGLTLKGSIDGKAKTEFTFSQITEVALEKMQFSGTAVFSDFSILSDSISLSTSNTKMEFALPNKYISKRNTNFAYIKIASDDLAASREEVFTTSMKNAHFFIEMSDIRDTTSFPELFCTFSTDSFTAGMDSISVIINKPLGNFFLSPAPGSHGNPEVKIAFASYQLNARAGQDSAVISEINLGTGLVYDKSQQDAFLQWLPNGFIDIDNGIVSLTAFSYPVEISKIKMEFEPQTFTVKEGRVNIERSDFELTGILNNVLDYFRSDSLLKGEFNLSSASVDLIQLLNFTNGIGASKETTEDQPSHIQDNNSFTGPYIVPQGIDVLLKADVREAIMGNDTARYIIGDVRVSDGILLLDALTFSTPAADMQLTAMYRTPRKNHLHLYLDYHMLDVEISRLLKMIPDIDTLMPMLRSFDGSGEFHIAIETYLDSLYNVKKSTLRGAASIKGEDLVLMDGETFSEIAKTFRFSKGAQNRVDSLSAEFTIFRDEIDVYPFLLVMDRYKVVVGGRHNFDMTFDYHISLVESPLPLRLGINVGGNMDDLKYRLASPRYAEFYRPASRREVENRQLEFRKMIREALLQNVR
jgi:hypothetical protein